ncbi:MAG TPA: DoxX family protein [Stellaceae bacterium]|nr:DoxX family protein [Stellaceae bacterium]
MTSAMRYLPVLGRVLMCVIFVLGGFGKLTHPSGTIGYIAKGGLPLPMVAYVISVIIELGGGLALLVGFKTRWVAAVLAVFCVVTALAFHNNFADQGQMVNFLKNLTMAGGFLFVVAHGAGPLSLDNRRG